MDFLDRLKAGAYDCCDRRHGREARMESEKGNEFQVRGEELLRKVKEIIHEGNVRRIIVKDDKGQTFIEIPLSVGVVGAFFLPVLAALGAMAALASNFTLQVVKRDDKEPPAA
jgi:hypothetical protein